MKLKVLSESLPPVPVQHEEACCVPDARGGELSGDLRRDCHVQQEMNGKLALNDRHHTSVKSVVPYPIWATDLRRIPPSM
jgi:hypothetical protein